MNKVLPTTNDPPLTGPTRHTTTHNEACVGIALTILALLVHILLTILSSGWRGLHVHMLDRTGYTAESPALSINFFLSRVPAGRKVPLADISSDLQDNLAFANDTL
jgi:hypothetical protein